MTRYLTESDYALRGTNHIVTVTLVEYDELSGLTMVHFTHADGSEGAMDKNTFLQFYITEVQDV